jgi:putative transposase
MAMKTLRRYDIRNRDYFITVVTQDRLPILLKDIDLFWQAMEGINLKAWAIMPDHFHIIMRIDDRSISDTIHRFKIKYSRYYRMKYGKGKVWQNRFFDHTIRDQKDMNRHLDYIHFNPVKHGICKKPIDYPHSSSKKFCEDGFYEESWGSGEIIEFEGGFGE